MHCRDLTFMQWDAGPKLPSPQTTTDGIKHTLNMPVLDTSGNETSFGVFRPCLPSRSAEHS